jgi:5-methylcytosine-specific restriction endonuclease McrA
MSKVFVLDTNKHPLDPVHPGRARLLLTQGRAAVFRRYPFTIILKEAFPQPPRYPLRLKIDPGSKTTGLALVDDASGEVVFAAELQHRGQTIKKALDDRRQVRRSRRQRKTRYRKPRFSNRARAKGWLPPSLESRVANTLTWVRRLMRSCPITAISQELVKFDLQLLQNPEIAGVEYQQGELAGYEVREYLLEKWERACAYCGAKEVPLEIEHILCRSRGGTHRVSNLTLACKPCNQQKGNRLIEEFLQDKPDLLKRILAQAKALLRDATAMNATRWELYRRLQALELPVETGTGGSTKYNRVQRGHPKTHWLDAACVGASTPESFHLDGVVPLVITAHGHGRRQLCLMDRRGFPRTKPKQTKRVKGFQTGDMVKAVVPIGVKRGTYVGRVAVRATGSFNITTGGGKTVQGIGYSHCIVLQARDGYSFQKGGAVFPPTP